jgi:hypothetical protein
MRILKKELWPHSVTVRMTQYTAEHVPIENWLIENIGAFRERWNQTPTSSYVNYYFKHHDDAVLFALRWS